MDSTVTIASLENGVEDAVLHFAAALMVAFLLRESALMYCAVRRKVLTAAMNVMNWKSVQKVGFAGGRRGKNRSSRCTAESI